VFSVPPSATPPGRELNSLILMHEDNPEELLRIVGEEVQAFNTINCATMFNR
jgi:hypothetical protein